MTNIMQAKRDIAVAINNASDAPLTEFAEAAGLSKSDASNLRNFKLGRMSVERLTRIAARFGFSFELKMRREHVAPTKRKR